MRCSMARTVRGIVQGDTIPQIFIPMLIDLYRKGCFPFDRLLHFYSFEDINLAAEATHKGETIKAILRIGTVRFVSIDNRVNYELRRLTMSATKLDPTPTLDVPATQLPAASHWIGGKWVRSGKPADSVNPATGEVIGRYFVAGPEEANEAVAAAKRAFQLSGWKDDRLLRARVLNAMADVFEQRSDELANLLALENGKILRHGHIEIGIVPQTLRFNAALALTDYGRNAQIVPGSLSFVLKQPAGVAGIIAPWNSPVALLIRSLAPALAAGATTAIMLPTQTAQVNALMSRIISEIGDLPQGVVNIFTGGHEAGNALVVSPDVPVLSFTGSTNTGRAISANAAPWIKRLGLELGGKTPMIGFEDADLTAVVPTLVEALTVFAGQFCATGNRLLVQRGAAARLRTALAERINAVSVGPASDPASEMSPFNR